MIDMVAAKIPTGTAQDFPFNAAKIKIAHPAAPHQFTCWEITKTPFQNESELWTNVSAVWKVV